MTPYWSLWVPIVLAAAAALSGCQSPPRDGDAKAPQGIVYSPNGEPLSGGPLGHPACAEALAGWFQRLDANHSGTLNEDAFIADARVQFARMDLDHDGAITPSELSDYRRPYEDVRPPEDPDHMQRPAPRRGPRRTSTSPMRDDSDPVMSADRDLNFRVNEEELVAHTRDVFQTLDKRHAGVVTLEDVQRLCRPARKN